MKANLTDILRLAEKRRSGEMADTEDLKSSGVNPHESSSLSSGISELRKAHECLLDTIGANRTPWIYKVHKNAKAYYETLKEKYKWT